HLGRTVGEDVEEYRRRSPAWNAQKLQTPLLVHTTTNDEDVHVLEVENLIKALKAAGKGFEHKVYPDAPGGHQFNRLDTRLARESRAEVYRFLAKHLSPPNPVKYGAPGIGPRRRARPARDEGAQALRCFCVGADGGVRAGTATSAWGLRRRFLPLSPRCRVSLFHGLVTPLLPQIPSKSGASSREPALPLRSLSARPG